MAKEVVLIDYSQLSADGVRYRLSDAKFTIRYFKDHDSACFFIGELSPDLIIFEYPQEKMGDLSWYRAVRKQVPNTPFLLYTACDDMSHLYHAFKSGVQGVLQKNGSRSLLAAIQRISAGHTYVDSALSAYIERLAEIRERLTPREFAVLNYLAQGANARRIADRLDISARYVYYLKRNIVKKLAVATIEHAQQWVLGLRE